MDHCERFCGLLQRYFFKILIEEKLLSFGLVRFRESEPIEEKFILHLMQCLDV